LVYGFIGGVQKEDSGFMQGSQVSLFVVFILIIFFAEKGMRDVTQKDLTALAVLVIIKIFQSFIWGCIRGAFSD
jgi:hypothetical protein